MQPAFTRGFRLHLADGRICHGAEFPSGRVFVLDDPEYGFATVATSLDDLLKGYHGARVEWPGDQLVPAALLEELLRIVAYVSRGPGRGGANEPYPDAASRAVLGRLTDYLGAEVVARASRPAHADAEEESADV